MLVKYAVGKDKTIPFRTVVGALYNEITSVLNHYL